MATNLKTDYKDYIPPESGKRYIITTNSQGYSTIQDATEYTQEGDTFGAGDINATNNAVNNLTAADVGAVSQTVYELTPQNGWKAASAASACHLIVTGRLAAITARLTAPSATIDSSNNLIFNLPSGVVPTKYIDVVMTCGGDISNAAGAQIGAGGSVVAFSGTLPSTGLLAIDAVFLIN